MKKFILLVSVLALSFLSVFMGAELFQEKHNTEVISQPLNSMKGYSTQRQVGFLMEYDVSTDVQKLASKIMDIADETDSDAIIMHSDLIPINEDIFDPSSTNNWYVYSNKSDLFPAYLLSDSNPKWGRDAEKVYTLDSANNINQITETVGGMIEDIKNVRYVPLVKMPSEFKPQNEVGNLGIYFLTDKKEQVVQLMNEEGQEDLISQPPVEFYSKGSAFFFLLVILVPILAIIISIYSLDVVDSTKEIGIRKIQGQNSLFIAKKRFLKINLMIPLVFMVGLFISSIFIIKHWNALTLEFMKWILLMFLALIAVLGISFLLSTNFIQHIRPSVASKRKPSFTFNQVIGIFIKMILIALLMGQVSMLSVRLENQINRYMASKTYNNPMILSAKASDDVAESEIRNIEGRIGLAFENNYDKFDTLKVRYTSKGSTIQFADEAGNFEEAEVFKSDVIEADYNLLKYLSILKTDGSKLTMEQAPKATTVLLPEDQNIKNIPPSVIKNLNGNSPTPILSEKDIPVVKTKKNQKYFVPEGKKAVNPIIVIYGENQYSGPSYILNTSKNYNLIKTYLENNGITEKKYSFVLESPMTPFNQDSGIMKRELITTIFLLVAFFLSMFHNVYVFMKDKSKLLTIKYLNGINFFKRTRLLWILSGIPYIICGFLFFYSKKFPIWLLQLRADFEVVDQYRIPLFHIFISLVVIYIIELIFQLFMLRRSQSKSAGILKGEM